MILIQFNCWRQWFSWMLVQWMTEGNFMACSCTESAAKVVQPQHSLIPTGGILCPCGSWDGTPRHHLTCSWLKLTGAPWKAWVALQWWKAHAKYRHFQPIWTQSQHRTPICTLIRLLKCLLNYQWEASCSAWNMPAEWDWGDNLR